MKPARLSGSNRDRLVSSTLAIAAVTTLLGALPLSAAPVHLRCNYQDRPLGIDTVQPRLSWQSNSTEKNWKQTAYRLIVASSPNLALAGKGDVWDSGKQDSAVSVDIPYSGPALQSRHRYFWSVQVWDARGRTTSPVQAAWWEMGMLQPSDWIAQWITGRDHATEEAEHLHWLWVDGDDALKVTPRAVATFRYTLDVEGKPQRALLSAAAHGDFAVTVNGRATGGKKEWTAFDVEDIADQLHPGKNEVAIVVTAPAPPGRPGQPAASTTGITVKAGLAVMISLTGQDGTTRHLYSGDKNSPEQWQATSAKTADKTSAWKPAQVVAVLDDPSMGVHPGLPPQPGSLLRRSFAVAKPVKQARLYVTAAGSYRMSINGTRVADTALTPDFTDYRKRVLYQAYDVTSMLTRGENAIGAILGDGWYASPLAWNGTRLFPAPVRLLAQLEVTYTDGTQATIATSPDWKTADSPILNSDIYAGEMYDARLEQRGWDTASFDTSKWAPVVPVKAPEGAVTAQIGQPVHLASTMQPKSVHQLPNGDSVFDMGQNMVGWTSLHVTGPAGAKVRLRFAERLNPDGSIYTENLRNADAEDIYTLRGGGPEVFAPHFTFHGFQYVQVSGLPAKPTLATLTGDVLHSLDTEPTGRLDTSSSLLNRMWKLGVWGQRGNFFSIPTDCPQRDERLGWMGDAGVFWRTGAYNFDIAAFTQKFMQDIVDAQSPKGAFSNVSPDMLQVAFGDSPGAPGWGDAGVIVPYTAWLQYGDRGLLEKSWPAMERWMDFIETSNPNFLREKEVGANFGDWLAPDQGTSKTLVGTAYWAIVAGMMRDMAKATGHDETKYTALYDHIRDAYAKAYLGPGGSVTGETQTSYLLTLYAGLAPESSRPMITEKLVANIKAHDGHLTTGFLGTPFLLFALSDNNRTDAAYDLLMQETYPSWGYMIAKGATTWWERWNGDSGDPAMNSYNHYSFGSVVAWIYRDTIGIDTLSPGFQHLVVKPHYTSKLTFAKGEYDSVYGTVKSGWTRTSSGTYHLSLTVPANVTATVYPDGESGTAVEVGSGTYEFNSKARSQEPLK
jgi:alpha-L-rhamnosidase